MFWWSILILIFFFAFFFTRFIVVIQKIHKNRNKPIHGRRKRNFPIKAMVIVGSGGHTSEILRLTSELRSIYTPRVYVVADTDKMSEDKILKCEAERSSTNEKDEYSILKIPRSREVKQSYVTSVWSTLYASIYSFPLVFRCRPDLILCNGPGTCIPLCFAGLLLTVLGLKRVTIVYVESICRVDTMSLSGKILYHVADHMLVQWPALQDQYPLTKYIGRVV